VADGKINLHNRVKKKTKNEEGVGGGGGGGGGVCTRWKLYCSSVARGEASSHWSAFSWKIIGSQSN
jgi:hypothetical protein